MQPVGGKLGFAPHWSHSGVHALYYLIQEKEMKIQKESLGPQAASHIPLSPQHNLLIQ